MKNIIWACIYNITLGTKKQESKQWQTQRPPAFSKKICRRGFDVFFLDRVCFTLKMLRAIGFVNAFQNEFPVFYIQGW